MMRQLGAQDALQDAKFDITGVQSQLLVITEPDTLQPHLVRTNRSFSMRIRTAAGTEENTQVDTEEWLFEYPAP
jgi:hypothetical protein